MVGRSRLRFTFGRRVCLLLLVSIPVVSAFAGESGRAHERPRVVVECTDKRLLEGFVNDSPDGLLRVEMSSGQIAEVELSRISRLVPKVDPNRLSTPVVPEGVVVSLAGGSQLRCESIAWKENSAEATFRLGGGGPAIGIPVKFISWIRFRALQGSQAPQWAELLRTPAATDRLVIAPGEFLDFYPGQLIAIEQSQVRFRLDDELIEVPIERLVGIVFAGQQPEEKAGRGCVIEHRGGSRLKAEKVLFRADGILFTVLGGPELRFPWEEVEAIVFENQIRLSLRSLEVIAVEYRPPVPLPGLEADLGRLFLPGGGETDVHSEGRGSEVLILPAGISVSWQLPEGAFCLEGVASAVSRAADGRVLEVGISVDEKTIALVELSPGQECKLSAEWSSGQRLQLSVRAKDGSNFGLFAKLLNAEVVVDPAR